MPRLSERVARARELRSRLTPWERKLWVRLRAKRFFGLKIKRQVPIGRYIVDFSCYEKKLVIELDGGHHALPSQAKQDVERTCFLESAGYTVLRFWNIEIDKNVEDVLEVIRRAVFSAPLLSSPLARGEELDEKPFGRGSSRST